jgi:hypothetical protein
MLKRPLARGANERIRSVIHSIVVCAVALLVVVARAAATLPARSHHTDAAAAQMRHNAVAVEMNRRRRSGVRRKSLCIMEEKPVSKFMFRTRARLTPTAEKRKIDVGTRPTPDEENTFRMKKMVVARRQRFSYLFIRRHFHQGPKRARYSPEVMKALTISAATWLPLKDSSLPSQKL